jgi:phosphatidylserine/phosphatidylglycerophosphate/cardiolipin synthase-like enzyme
MKAILFLCFWLSLNLVSVANSWADLNPEGNIVTILPEGNKNLQELLNLVYSTKENDKIRLSTYVLSEDVIGRTVMHALAEAGRRGVEVHMIVDPSHEQMKDRYIHFLESANVKVKEFHPMGGETALGKIFKTITHGIHWMNNRSHDKMLVVERKTAAGLTENVAFMGSSNLVDAHFQLDPTWRFERDPKFWSKALVVLKVARDRLGRYLQGGGRDSKKIDTLLDAAVESEARGNPTFRQEVRARLEAIRGKYHDLGYQYVDVNYLVKGPAAKALLDYHDSVWSGGHAEARYINKRFFAKESDSMIRLRELDGLPIQLTSSGRPVDVSYSQELFRLANRAKIGEKITLGGREIVITPSVKGEISRQLITLSLPPESLPGLSAPLEINASPEEMRMALIAKPGEEIVIDGARVKVTSEWQDSLRTRRYEFRISGGQWVDLSFDDLVALRAANVGAKVRVGQKVLEVDEALKKAILSATPEQLTSDWVKSAFDHVERVGYIQAMDKPAPLRATGTAVGKIELYLDKMSGNVPQGSEQGPLEVFRRAAGGDMVSVNGEKVLFTADLFRDLERARVGQVLEISGQQVELTEEIFRNFARATPADEVNLLNQYGQLTPDLREEMLAASSRGVKINFVVNGPRSLWDGTLPVRGYELTFEQLVETGARVVEYPLDNKQIHAKIFTVTNPMAAYLPTEMEARYPANPKNPGVVASRFELGEERLQFKDVVREELANRALNPRHVRGYTVTGTSNIDARSLTQTTDPKEVKGVLEKLKAWSTGLRNSELNLGIHGLGIAQEMNLRIQQAGAGGHLVADRGKKTKGTVRSCSQLYNLLAPLI